GNGSGHRQVEAEAGDRQDLQAGRIAGCVGTHAGGGAFREDLLELLETTHPSCHDPRMRAAQVGSARWKFARGGAEYAGLSFSSAYSAPPRDSPFTGFHLG